MFVLQPAHEFGQFLRRELNSTDTSLHWDFFEFAVAWINRRGMQIIAEPARSFLAAGHAIRATVGLDFASTSLEGLDGLLQLEADGADITTHVFFDENPSCTFHPKVYLFRNGARARLIVGSNNMTGAGLRTNIEASLCLDCSLDDSTLVAAMEALSQWRNPQSEFRSKRLTSALLSELSDCGLVRSEADIQRWQNAAAARVVAARAVRFGRSITRRRDSAQNYEAVRIAGTLLPHAIPPLVADPIPDREPEEVLLMRVRKRRDGRQVQISMRVLENSFLNAVNTVLLADGTTRHIGFNEARGSHNTARFEAPELADMANPVARFRRVSIHGRSEILFELFDADAEGEGEEILRQLEEGISTPPYMNLAQLRQEQTALSTSNRETAQWYRLAID